MPSSVPSKRGLYRWGPVALYVLVILVVSSIPSLSPPIQFGGSDKVAHVVEYGILGLLLRRSWIQEGTPGWFAAILGAALVAFLDEMYQRTVPGRSSSVADAIADLLGAGIGAWLFPLLKRPHEPGGGADAENNGRGDL